MVGQGYTREQKENKTECHIGGLLGIRLKNGTFKYLKNRALNLQPLEVPYQGSR
jgi:hypothetical protein